jgi:palmitoyltransferase
MRPRTKHCNMCEACVGKFDHHCWWIGSCVGELNHRKYLLMLFFLVIELVQILVYCWSGMTQSIKTFDAVQGDGDGELAYAVFLVCFVFTVIPLVFVVMLLFYHSFLIGLNTTTWEHRRRANINYMRVYPTGEFPFNGGVVDNYGEVCCHGEK